MNAMKATYCLSAVIVPPLTLLASVWLCLAGEVNYLEPFDKLPDSSQLITALSNGVCRAWTNFPAHNPTNAMASLRLLCYLRCCADIRPGHDLELRADVLRVSGQGGYATLGWSDGGIDAGYCVFLNSREVALVKHRFDRQVLSPFFWDPLPVTNRPVILFLRFRMTESTLSLQTQVLDLENPGIVIFEKTVEDTPASDPVAATSPPL